MNISSVYIASDHGGYDLKCLIVKELTSINLYEVKDLGPFNTLSVDYPEYAWNVAECVSRDRKELKNSFGILICGSGIGVSIAANKKEGIRAALSHNKYTAEMSRRHNDAQVLCLGARVVDKDLALLMVNTFLSTDFEGGRHEKRIKSIDALK